MSVRQVEGAPAGVLHLQMDGNGTLTADDYRDVIEPAIAAGDVDDIRMVIELVEGMPSVELAALVEDARSGWKHRSGWTRIAVVSERSSLQRLADVFSVLVPGEMRGFEAGEGAAALEWAAGSDD